MNHLRCERITKTFEVQEGHCTVLESVSLTFQSGSSYALMGISGSGKSTFLSLLAGLEEPTSGTVFLDQERVTDLAKQCGRSFFCQKMGIIFQKPHLVNELTVLENVILKGLIKSDSPAFARDAGYTILEQVGLADKALLPVTVLSGGEQQRVAVARALYSKPLFLLADEPTAHLDAFNRELILNLLLERCQQGQGLIVTCHDPYVARAMHTVFKIENGKVEEEKAF